MSTGVTVGSLVGLHDEASGLGLEVLAGGAGLDRRISTPFLRRIGLALAGVDEDLGSGHALVFGESERQYLNDLDPADCAGVLDRLLARDLPCIVVTGDIEVPTVVVEAGDGRTVPILRTALPTDVAMARLTTVLEEQLAPRDVRHGVLVDVLGLGIFVTGESGIGKSECALDLVVRGHRLVADDAVEVRCLGGAVLVGRSPEFTRHHMEIRGLGIVNVTDLFGVAATSAEKRIELVVRLERWERGREYDWLGLESATTDILDVALPLVTIPVATARNLAMLVEVAARNHLLRTRGRHAARLLASRLEQRLEALGHGQTDPEGGRL